jgi:hypothetical protein
VPYANGETSMSGDRIKDVKGRIGTVTTVRLGSGLERIMIRWDEGVVEISYAHADDFSLVSRAPCAAEEREAPEAIFDP